MTPRAGGLASAVTPASSTFHRRDTRAGDDEPSPHAHAPMELSSSPLPTPELRQRTRAPQETFEARWARTQDEVREAQRLRHRVFADEMGARLQPLPGTPPGH